jgi:hypothetical protein
MAYSIVAMMCLVLAALSVVLAIRVLAKPSWILGWLRGNVGGLLLIISLFGALLAWDLSSYEQLNKEQTVAHLSFTQESDQLFLVTVTEPDGRERKFRLKGDLWQLDARIVKWAPSLARIGMRPGLRLDRLSGRYFALEQEEGMEKTLFSLGPEVSALDAWRLVQRYGQYLPWVEAVYGSATYLPMSDGALFSVTLSGTGLLARPLNERAQQAAASWE